MKLRAITLENVRRFIAPVRMEGIGDGLNVLCEPNEHGKSTLFDAIQALFFKPHGSRDRDVSALRPHAGGAPEVSVEVETDEGRFVIAKRWFSKPAATVHRGTQLVAQADAAEAWIADLLGGGDGGPSGLIWVRQGVTDLTGGSPKEQKTALEARRDLMSSVGEEVEAMTGGRRMDSALARCRAELEAYATGKNRNPKRGGPWKDAQERVEALKDQRDTLAATAAELHEALSQRKRARRELREIEDPEAAQARQQKLDAARTAHRAAERHAERVETEARKVEMARLAATSAQSRLDALRTAQTERAKVTDLTTRASTQAAETAAALETARTERDTAERGLENALTALKQAEATRRRAERAQAARDGTERREDLQRRITEAEAARAACETAEAAARTGPDADALRRIDALASRASTAIATRDATATQVIAHYADGRADSIHCDGTPLPGGSAVPLPRATRLIIDGVGALEIRPGETGHDDDTVAKAEAALRDALDAVGADSVADAHKAGASRADAARRHGEARAILKGLAPEGIDHLRDALGRIPQPDAADDAPPLSDAEAALNATQLAHDKARAARDAAVERLSDARDAATRAETTLTSLRERLARANEAFEALGDADEDTLTSEVAQAADALRTAEAAHAELVRTAPDLASTAAALKRAESVAQSALETAGRLKPLIATLEERIARASGDAVEERLAETEQMLDAATADLTRIDHEVAVLIRLEDALEDARTQARERYFTPVATELRPLLHLLWPEAELTWEQDTLLPDALIRDGQSEPIDILSGGTQEQVALLVRLGFARMLAASGRIAPVILDDALVFTDDDRIERMFDALHRQAGDLQIIVFTCRQRAFRDLGGNVLHLRAPAD